MSGVAASSTAVLAFVLPAGNKYVVRPVRAYFKRMESRAEQLEHNGGSSMRDDMTHVRASIDAIGVQLRTVAIDVLGVHTKLESLEHRQDAHEAVHPINATEERT